jgi:hypothetical protein
LTAGYNLRSEEVRMRWFAFVIGTVLFFTLLPLPRSAYACPA